MANQILAADKIIQLNDSPLMGQVQSVDYNASLNSEDVFELGSTTRVTAAQELETSGSFDVLSVGGTAGLLARMIPKRVGGAFMGYEFDYPIVAEQTASAGSATTITGTGFTGSAHVGQYVVITAGAGVGQRRKITANTTTVITFAPAMSPVPDNTSDFIITGGNNGYSFTQANLTETQFDLVIHEKSDQVNFDRTTILPRCFLTTISGRADAGGSASETYNFASDFLVVNPTPYHDGRAIPATRTTSTTCTLLDVAVATGTHTLQFLYVDEKRLETTNTDPTYATLGAAGVITVTGMTIPTTAILRALVYKTTGSTTFPVIASQDRATSANFVRGWQGDVYIAPADANNPLEAERWLKVQSIDWSIDLRSEALRQIASNAAGTSVYCRVPTLPFNITCNVSVYESDWADWKAMFNTTEKPFGNTGTDVYGESYSFSPNDFKESFSIVVRYRTKSLTLLQTWNFSDMKPEGLGDRTNVGGRAEVSWSFRGTAFTLTGLNA